MITKFLSRQADNDPLKNISKLRILLKLYDQTMYLQFYFSLASFQSLPEHVSSSLV